MHKNKIWETVNNKLQRKHFQKNNINLFKQLLLSLYPTSWNEILHLKFSET